MKTEGRAQSVPRDEMLQRKVKIFISIHHHILLLKGQFPENESVCVCRTVNLLLMTLIMAVTVLSGTMTACVPQTHQTKTWRIKSNRRYCNR